MSNITTQKHIIEDVASVEYITGALRDISAIELQGLRERYTRNELFYADLRNLHQLVWRIAETTGKNDLFVTKNKGSLFVAYTTNKHFYGSLNYDVMQAFIKATTSKDACLILGGTGKEIWRGATKKRKETTFLSFKDDAPDSDEIRGFLERISAYAHVHIWYPGFVSMYEQSATTIDITFRPERIKDTPHLKEELPQYFLEPDLEQMFAFFTTQVRYILFERVLLETQLSRVAARLVKMDTADHNAIDMLKREYREMRRARNSFSSSRMLETLVGYIQWHNTTT